MKIRNLWLVCIDRFRMNLLHILYGREITKKKNNEKKHHEMCHSESTFGSNVGRVCVNNLHQYTLRFFSKTLKREKKEKAGERTSERALNQLITK